MIKILRNIKIGLLLVAVLIMRPTFLGQQYALLSLPLCLIALGIHAIELLKTKDALITKKNFILSVSILMLWSYFTLHSLAVGADNITEVVSVAVSVVVAVLVFSVILSRETDNKKFFRGFIKMLAFFSASYVLTVFIGLFVDRNSLHLFDIPIQYYNYPAMIYFPLTPISSFINIGGFEFPRLIGMFREPGILQAFLIWAYYNLEQYGLNSKKMKITLVAGIIGTFSTAGIAIFVAVFALRYLLRRKYVKGFVLVLVCYFALIYAPVIGLQDKSTTHGASLDIRSEMTISGLEKMIQNPIGTGIYNKSDFDSQYSNINLLASSYTIGLMGLLFFLLVFFIPMFNYPFKANYLIGITPLMITLLYSQPIADTPIVYILILASYGISSKAKIEVQKPKRFKRFKRYKLTW